MLAVKQLPQLIGVDPRHRDMRADPVDHECQHQKDQAPLEIAVFSGVA